MTEVLAAIDIGTNSMHLVVARSTPGGGFEVITTEKEMVRLGRGSGDMKRLTEAAIDRGIAALGRMSSLAESHEARLVAVATSAVREAENRDDFLDRARDEVGVEVEVISGFEEARLIHLGVLQALPVFDRRLLLIDIGGGSTEYLVGHRGEVLEARSIRLGAIRLTERFFTTERVEADAVAECRTHVRSMLEPIARAVRGHAPDVVVGSSGTIATVAAMAAARRGESFGAVNGSRFTTAELEAMVDDLAGTSSDDRRKWGGLDEKRVDIIVGGMLLLAESAAALHIDEFVVSDYALREGVLLDRFEDQGVEHLRDLRRANVARLADQLDPDADHARHSAALALAMFDRTRPLHGLGDDARELLDVAAQLHNIGLFISHSGHHKHSEYVIRHTEQLTGFTDHEIELIAQVARYHRKSLPTTKHAPFAALDEDDRQVVRVLAGLVRIAIGLDRRHAAAVKTVRVVVDRDDDGAPAAIQVDAVPADADDPLTLELHAAAERSRLATAALGAPVTIHRGERL